jgi:hypothetical protein
MNSKQDIIKQETKDNPLDSKSEIIIAVLAIISKKSREHKRTIAAASLREIRNGLKKHYEKDLSERQILNVIHDLGKIVIKEKDPRNHRRSLYRTNPNFIEEVTLTLIKINKEENQSKDFEGILYAPLVKTDKKKFLVIDKA